MGVTGKLPKCWASILGGCEGGPSRQHYVTRGLYSGNVNAIGLPWAEGPVDLPIGALAAKILCRRHNELLSPVDGEAIRMKNFIDQAMASLSSGDACSSQKHHCSVDGRKIIRWFCKTICDLEALAKRKPEEVYVRRAFGRPNAPVHVYMDKVRPVTKTDTDTSHIRIFPCYADLRAGGRTAVYIIRFAIFEWLVAPFSLTQDICDALGKLTDGEYWFKAKPIVRTTTLPMGWRPSPGKKPTWTHQLTFKMPKKRR